MIQALNHALITEKYCLRSKMRPSSRLSQISSTPKRPLTQAEENAKQSTALRHTNISRAQTPLNNGPAVKKYKAAITIDAKPRIKAKSSMSSLRSVPGNLESPRTPTRSRPTTPIPGSPRHTPSKRPQSRCEDIFIESEMDVSRIDPEQALIDAENVEVDLSAELDEREVRSLLYGHEDKVHVSVRWGFRNTSQFCRSNDIIGSDPRIRT